jgi:hypothetical protein
MAAVVAARDPGWTGGRSGDPGVTLLELMAWLAEGIEWRMVDPRQALLLAAIRASLDRRPRACDRDPDAPERVRYFEGGLLTAADLRGEQDYQRHKLRRVLQHLHGSGIVDGLAVTVAGSTNGDASVTVEAGSAITPCGELLVVDPGRACTLAASGSDGFVVLVLEEVAVKPAPVGSAGATEATRIAERATIVFASSVPADGVVLARLVRDGGSWVADATLAPPRARR